MSGVFNPNEPGIRATDDPAVAKAHGLTEFDEQRGQYVASARTDRDERAARVEAAQAEETDRTERAARDEDPAEHDALARGLAPGEQPAATEGDNAEPIVAGTEQAEAPEDRSTSGRKRK